ncbi:hypothetical protein ACFFGH_21025 [Lysobacter korlensis]|uniref:Transcriptional regulator n=1 Tax=Lysobacter korlensis TaxID=553636 RepID=A0ABV6RU60_9GAMM
MDNLSEAENLERVDRLTDKLVLATTNLLRDRTPMPHQSPASTAQNRVALVELQAALLQNPEAAVVTLGNLAQAIATLIVASGDDSFSAAALKRELTDDRIANFFLMRAVSYAALLTSTDTKNIALAKDRFLAAFDEVGAKPTDEIVRGTLTLAMHMSSIQLAQQALECGYVKDSKTTVADLSRLYMGMP